MREYEVENVLQDAIEKASVGQKIKGTPQIIDVEMSFKGGWVVTQTIIPESHLNLQKVKMVTL